MFDIKSIQAEHGDAMLISYGDRVRPFHLLIDGGTTETVANLLTVLADHRINGRLRLEALVVTHYDLDHIQGIIELLQHPPEWLDVDDVWFNGRHHIVERDILGHEEGTELSKLIAAKYSWNGAFAGAAVRIEAGPVTLPGGMTATVLSPDQSCLNALAAEWPAGGAPPPDQSDIDVEPDMLGRDDTWPPGSFNERAREKSTRDNSPANGSSIALMLEFDGRRALLAGDAFSPVVAAALKSAWPSNRPTVDLFKLSHHGSKRNTDDTLLAAVECQRFLFSTNGRVHKHPDTTLVARVLRGSSEPVLIFNYEQERTSGWRVVPSGWPDYTTVYPEPGACFVKIEL
ncbi:ComEC/Rec2 family competence protein [Rhizobium leguminosarum]|uniref:MBL fold metallo-hydrolase n=1 Tax=Rhizobium leguminosarum TaxID=384 RepID=A0A7K3VU28_RHILE|nr:hypothetical protein [Rhizobium leguminosarum]NEK20362.1 hypothetical protein [Rhizobium leguminosarum]